MSSVQSGSVQLVKFNLVSFKSVLLVGCTLFTKNKVSNKIV
uniref:Uncharacterized protein n=1 Tax=Anguilla anguilla TaxID=7936 RepID=A0A0E9XY02_ANGAN